MVYTITYWSWNQYIPDINVKRLNPGDNCDFVPDKEDWLVVFQPYSLEIRKLVDKIIGRFEYSKRVLVHYEGRYKQPHGFKLRYQQLFGRIYTYNSTDIDGETVKYFPIPLWVGEEDCIPTGDRSKLLCSVVTNCLQDREPRGRVTARLKALGMDVYGRYNIPLDVPNENRYKTKIKAMSNYIFAFSCENQLDLGHITEKLFDSIAAGCIPVYLGPLDTFKFIPKECYIDYRDFWSEMDLIHHLRNMSGEEIKKYQRAIMKYQKSLVGMRTYEACMRFLCKDLGFECSAPYYKDILELSNNITTKD
jgi:hypothetical protein